MAGGMETNTPHDRVTPEIRPSDSCCHHSQFLNFHKVDKMPGYQTEENKKLEFNSLDVELERAKCLKFHLKKFISKGI